MGYCDVFCGLKEAKAREKGLGVDVFDWDVGFCARGVVENEDCRKANGVTLDVISEVAEFVLVLEGVCVVVGLIDCVVVGVIVGVCVVVRAGVNVGVIVKVVVVIGSHASPIPSPSESS